MQPDKVDWQIIELLSRQHDTNTTIANELGVSEGMIRQRMKKLQDAGIVKIRALRDPEVLENPWRYKHKLHVRRHRPMDRAHAG